MGGLRYNLSKGFRRIRRICSEDEGYWKYGKKVEEKLVSRGYGRNQVRKQMEESFKMEREEALKRVEKRSDKRINFVLTHSGYLPNVNRILKRHEHYLKEDEMSNYVTELPRLSLRRGKNLGDLIVNAKARDQEGGSGPCGRKCKLCKYMRETDTVKDKDGKEMKLGRKMDCQRVGAIYGMHCKKCKPVYLK